jgi:hypothetical protein
MPTREQLEEHRKRHADRFERGGRVRFQHVFLSRSKRGDALAGDASAMRERLSQLGNQAPHSLGDPLPGLRSEQVARVSEIREDYGAEVAAVIEEAVLGVWRGPVPSVYGLHFVKVIGKQPPYLPPLDVIGAEVRADRLREIRDELRKERMGALRDAYTVHIERVP